MSDFIRDLMPSSMRGLTSANAKQNRALYEKNMEDAQRATLAWVSMVAPHFAPVQKRGYEFAKQNVIAYFDLLDRMAEAKDMQDVLRLQADYARVQMQTYAEQARELGHLMALAAQHQPGGLPTAAAPTRDRASPAPGTKR